MVYIIGTGPGSYELMTVKAAGLLSKADVVIAKESIPEEMLSHCRKDAEIYRSATLGVCETVVSVLAMAERAGKVSLYLVNGDVAVYGTVQDVLYKLQEEGFSYEIVPGVSSVGTAAAMAGVELMVPCVSQSLVVTRLNGLRSRLEKKQGVAGFASHHCTYAILMVHNHELKRLRHELLRGGLEKNTPVVAVEDGSLPGARMVRTTIDRMDTDAAVLDLRRSVVLAGWVLADKAVLDKKFKPVCYADFSKSENFMV